MQVCHGKAAPLRRVRHGDRVVYYAPTETFGGADRLQQFVAIGIVRGGEPYVADPSSLEGGDFCPFRRDVDWLASRAAPIAPLLERLAFTRGRRNWGYPLRRGLLAIGDADMAVIAAAMAASVPLSPMGGTAASAAAPGRAG
jgi:hypothetical protein